jgi:hypothetical protein
MVKLAGLLVTAILTSCALFAEGPPENFCRTDEDCFRAQGETCDLDSQSCIPGEVPPDAGVDAGVDAPIDAN